MVDLEAALPEYELLGELGRGSMGIVLLARHRSLGRSVAIKELPVTFAADEKVRKRFLREARTVAGLDHPHVVVVHDFIDREGHLAIVMEQLPGGTVWDRFLNQGVTAQTACGLILAASSGLDHAHRHDVLHRDIKPENLMFTADGQVKVTDFGMAKVMGGEKTLATANGAILGTPAYMAPEQAEGHEVGPQADVYALSTMLYEMLAGDLPFASAPTQMAMLVARIKEDAPSLKARAPSTPPVIARVVMTALSRSIDDRYPDVKGFATALGRAASASWGPEWLTETGLRISGNEAIEQAARSRRAGSILDVDDEDRRARSSTRESTRAPATILDEPAHSPGRSSGHATVDPRPIVQQPSIELERDEALVVGRSAGPVASRRQPVGPLHRNLIDLNQISLAEVLDINQVHRAPSPVMPMLIAALLAVASVGLIVLPFFSSTGTSTTVVENEAAAVDEAITVAGQPVAADTPPTVNLDEPLIVTGLGSGSTVELRASIAQIPLGQVEAPIVGGRAEIDPAYLRWTTTGRFDAEAIVDGDAVGAVTVALVASHRWFATGPAIAVAFVALFALASVRSHLRGQRFGRFRVGSVIGLVVAGAQLGAAAGTLVRMAGQSEITIGPLVLTGLFSAATMVACGETYRRFARRNRMEPTIIL